MPWTCPKCFRQFKHAAQYHSCVKLNSAAHFIGKNPNIIRIYEKILKETKKIGRVNVSTVKSGIMLKNISTFLAMKPGKSWLDIEFFLPEEVNEFPVHRTFRYSKNKVVHSVRLGSPGEVDRQLVRWMKTSYNLSGKK